MTEQKYFIKSSPFIYKKEAWFFDTKTFRLRIIIPSSYNLSGAKKCYAYAMFYLYNNNLFDTQFVIYMHDLVS